MHINIKRGLDVRIGRRPPAVSAVEPIRPSRVAVLPVDYHDLRPDLAVAEGDRVAAGQALFTDRLAPDIRFAAPAAGVVRAIDRGPRRRIERIVIELEGDDAVRFPTHSAAAVGGMDRDTLRDILLRSGAWTALRARPFDRIARPDIEPRAIYVTAIDTQPLAPDPAAVLAPQQHAFAVGLIAIARLSDGMTYVCTAPGAAIPVPEGERLQHVEFGGPHPAGLPGTHMHAVGPPMGTDPDLWHIGYQDVAAIGRLLLDGRVDPSRVISIGGPAIDRPRLVSCIQGAQLDALLDRDETFGCRVISGSALSGSAPAQFLGRFANQVTVIPEPGAGGVRAGSWIGRVTALLSGGRVHSPSTTATHGSRAGMLPLESYEAVWPFRTPPAPLLRALLTCDADTAVSLGGIGLAEDDVALCGFVCPAKRDYPGALRATLREIERRA
jgi:Na+-transporting NADH:ubiquinone oxidoreductase subunit A